VESSCAKAMGGRDNGRKLYLSYPVRSEVPITAGRLPASKARKELRNKKLTRAGPTLDR
jgi:hypothetical protein